MFIPRPFVPLCQTCGSHLSSKAINGVILFWGFLFQHAADKEVQQRRHRLGGAARGQVCEHTGLWMLDFWQPKHSRRQSRKRNLACCSYYQLSLVGCCQTLRHNPNPTQLSTHLWVCQGQQVCSEPNNSALKTHTCGSVHVRETCQHQPQQVELLCFNCMSRRQAGWGKALTTCTDGLRWPSDSWWCL